MTADTEQLLELAAQACGIQHTGIHSAHGLMILDDTEHPRWWSPLARGGDCEWTESTDTWTRYRSQRS